MPNYETEVRAFAQQFDTPNVRRMVALCESGQIRWEQAYGLATKVLSETLTS